MTATPERAGSGSGSEPEFAGVIGREWSDSTPWWRPERAAPAGAPNVLLVVLDDVGFAQLGCYGSDIDTPTIDRLASEGVRLTNFHTTALCSPTRSCLMTGRNHHSNGMGRVADLAMGFPGYCGEIPRANGFLSEILRRHGYATYAVGKWHLTPDDETHMAGDRSTWPLGRGFDRWYGFHGGETHQFVPTLYCDNHAVQPPNVNADGAPYHLSADLADRAIEFLSDQRNADPDQPFFCYLATGACHSPHHAPPEWIARYEGRFDDGWDAWRARTHRRQIEGGVIPPDTPLSERPEWVPAWEDLHEPDQRVAARFMECFAAFLSYTDAQLGRVLDFLRETGDLDDTIVVLVSDNGASGEGGAHGSINDIRLMNMDVAGRKEMRARIDELGGPTLHNNYPWGWTMAGNTPFRRWKREVHEGGIADPCIVRVPARLVGAASSAGGVRRQFAHAIDVFPTLLEILGIAPPDELGGVAQRAVEGTSFAYVLPEDGRDAPELHDTQYFEMLGSRAIYHRGWKAVTFKSLGLDVGGNPFDTPFDDDVWELYHVAEDPAETRDRASDEPERLATLVDLWWEQARAYQVLPISNRVLDTILNPRPRRLREHARHVYHPFGAPVPESIAVNVKNRSHTIAADIDVPADGTADGVLLALGCVLGGFSLHVKDGRLRYVHNLYGKERHTVTSDRVLGPGAHTVELRYTSDGEGGGTAVLCADGDVVGEGNVARFTPTSFNGTGAGLTCGYELGPAVGDDYDAPFRFTGTLHRVVVEVDGDAHVDPHARFDEIMAEQ